MTHELFIVVAAIIIIIAPKLLLLLLPIVIGRRWNSSRPDLDLDLRTGGCGLRKPKA